MSRTLLHALGLAVALPLAAGAQQAAVPDTVGVGLVASGAAVRPRALGYQLLLVRDSAAVAAGGRPILVLPLAMPGVRPELVRVWSDSALEAAMPAPALPGDSLGVRRVTVRETRYGSAAALAISDSMWGARLPMSVDSLVVARADLAPLHWEARQGQARLAAEFSRDTLYGAVQGPALRRPLLQPSRRGVVVNAAALEMLLPLLPLRERWQAALPLLLVDLGGSRLVWARLTVEGQETVQVPAGSFDCWVVSLRTDREEKRLWVRRDDPVVVRSTQLLPQLGGAMLESVLTSVQ